MLKTCCCEEEYSEQTPGQTKHDCLDSLVFEVVQGAVWARPRNSQGRRHPPPSPSAAAASSPSPPSSPASPSSAPWSSSGSPGPSSYSEPLGKAGLWSPFPQEHHLPTLVVVRKKETKLRCSCYNYLSVFRSNVNDHNGIFLISIPTDLQNMTAS